MRICFVVPSLTRGGSERQAVTLSDHLIRRGHECSILPLRSGGALQEEAIARGVPILRPGHAMTRLARPAPDILYPFLTAPCVLATVSRSLLRRSRLVWGIRHAALEFQHHRWYAPYGTRVAARLARFADAIVSNSEAGRASHESLGYPKSKMHVIQNGFDTELFQREPASRMRLRAEWGVGARDHLIGCVGRAHAMKDRANFVRAAAIVAASRQDVRWIVVGEANEAERARLFQLADRHGLRELLIVGARDDMPAVYSALDVLCLSSRASEGFPNAVGEAMACEVPCVVTDVGDAASVVGREGAVVPPSDPDALASGLQAMVENLGRDPDFGGRARGRIIHNFSAALAAERTERLCESLL